MEEETEDPRQGYIEIKEHVAYMIHQLIDVADHIDRGLDQNLLDDPDWHKQLTEMGNFLTLDSQMSVQMLPDDKKEALRKLMMGNE